MQLIFCKELYYCFKGLFFRKRGNRKSYLLLVSVVSHLNFYNNQWLKWKHFKASDIEGWIQKIFPFVLKCYWKSIWSAKNTMKKKSTANCIEKILFLLTFLFHKYRLGSSATTAIILFNQCDLQQYPRNISSTRHSVDATFHWENRLLNATSL